MQELIIEANGTREEETSLGFKAEIAVVRFVYLTIDDDTGARECTDIVEIDMENLDPAYAAIRQIDLSEVETVSLRDVQAPTDQAQIAEFSDDPRYITMSRMFFYYLCMVKAHALGYKDYDGQIQKEHGGCLLQAYRNNPEGEFGPYIHAAYAK
jgi:hypothetical protein